jgi:hypothetical protein
MNKSNHPIPEGRNKTRAEKNISALSTISVQDLMKNEKQKLGGEFIFAILLWLGTWMLMIPLPHGLTDFPTHASSLWGLGYLMSQPITRFGNPDDAFIAYHSFYIGLACLLIASAIVILVGNKSRRIAKIVAGVDALILAIWVLVSWP